MMFYNIYINSFTITSFIPNNLKISNRYINLEKSIVLRFTMVMLFINDNFLVGIR